jgi:NADH-quinone oxidoreductase subunit E
MTAGTAAVAVDAAAVVVTAADVGQVAVDATTVDPSGTYSYLPDTTGPPGVPASREAWMTTEAASEPTRLSFSAEAEAKFQKELTKYPNKRAALLPTLYIAQAEFGHLSVDVMNYVAERLELPPSKVLQVATFYTMYHKQPAGRHHIEVCTSVPCCMMGGYKLVRFLEHELGIQRGEVTDDGRFSLAEADCLAGCGHAPLLQINSMYFENLMGPDGEIDADKVRRVLEEHR